MWKKSTALSYKMLEAQTKQTLKILPWQIGGSQINL